MKAIQIWQYGLPTAAEASLDEAIATAKQFGFDALMVKALDGLNWMAKFDSHPDALRSVDQVAAQAAQAHAAGLQYFVWTNPRHDVDVDQEAALTAQIAVACDGVFLDTEPYAQFWNNDAPIGLAAHFMDVLRAAAPNAMIVLQPDPRPNALVGIKVDEWMPKCSAIAGQHYWSDFGSDPRSELQYAAQLGTRFGVPCYPTLPGNADPSSVPADQVAGFPGFVAWRLGTTGPAMLQILGAIVPAPSVPAPTPEDAVPEEYTKNGWVRWEDVAINLRSISDSLGQQLEQANTSAAQAASNAAQAASNVTDLQARLKAAQDEAAADKARITAAINDLGGKAA